MKTSFQLFFAFENLLHSQCCQYILFPKYSCMQAPLIFWLIYWTLSVKEGPIMVQHDDRKDWALAVQEGAPLLCSPPTWSSYPSSVHAASKILQLPTAPPCLTCSSGLAPSQFCTVTGHLLKRKNISSEKQLRLLVWGKKSWMRKLLIFHLLPSRFNFGKRRDTMFSLCFLCSAISLRYKKTHFVRRRGTIRQIWERVDFLRIMKVMKMLENKTLTREAKWVKQFPF